MKLSKLLIFFFAIALSSCSSKYGNEEIINDIMNNDSDRIIKNFFEKHKLEREDFKKVVESYSKFLGESNLKRIEYDDQFSFKRRKRHGYIFLNDDNNFVASITFKYVMVEDSSYQVNFIDFRNSTNELPCIKFPSKFPIKCLALPVPAPPKIDSLNKIYPKDISNQRFYHLSMGGKKYVEAEGDTLKRIISFNNGNALISKHLSTILNKIDNKLGLEYYTLCESNSIGEPTINLSYDPEVHQEYEISEIKSILEEVTNSNVRLKKQKTVRTSWGFVEPIISIGYPVSEARVKFF